MIENIDMIDENETEKFNNLLKEYWNPINIHDTECGITTDSQLNLISYIKSESEKWIKIPQKDITKVNNSYFGIIWHSHINSKMPLPSWEDIEYGILELNVKYNLISTENNELVIIRNNTIFNKPPKEKLKEEYEKAVNDRNKYIYNEELRLKNKYKEENNLNEISSSKYKEELKIIEKKVKYHTIKEQIQFFDNRLKKYGIELRFIKY